MVAKDEFFKRDDLRTLLQEKVEWNGSWDNNVVVVDKSIDIMFKKKNAYSLIKPLDLKLMLHTLVILKTKIFYVTISVIGKLINIFN